MAEWLKNPPVNAGDIRHTSLISGSARSLGGGNGHQCSIIAWKIPWAEEPRCGLNHCSAHKLLPHSRSSTNITWSPHSHTHMCQAHVSSFLLNETFPSSSMQSLSTKHNGTSEGSKTWDLSDCPMVKTLHFPCRGQEQGFNMLGGPAKKKSSKTWVTTYRIPHKILFLCAWIQWTAKKNQTKVPGSISRSKCGQHTTGILLA